MALLYQLNFIKKSAKVPVDQGFFQQGQDIHILFNQLSIVNGPHLQDTFSTITGQSQSNVLFDLIHPLHNTNNNSKNNTPELDGPILFLPTIPINTTSNYFAFLNDTFSRIVGANVINNATTFGIEMSLVSVPGSIYVGHLLEYWNKTTGLLISYDSSVSSFSNPNQVVQLKLHYLGESTRKLVFVPPTTTTTSTSSNSTSTSAKSTLTTAPGFSFIGLFSVFIGIAVYTRKRKQF